MSHPFTFDAYFESTEFADLFADCEAVWEVLPKIGPYLASMTLGAIEGDIASGAHLVRSEEIYIAPGVVVEAGAYIQGPCWLGEGTVVRHGAYLRGHVIAGKGCVIGHATEVKNALLFEGAKAAHFAYVGDSLLGRGVNLGAGSKLANFRFDGGNIVVRDGKIRVETGLRKLGAIMGDGVQTGCNAVTNPGVVMGKGARCLAGAVVTGAVAAGETFRRC